MRYAKRLEKLFLYAIVSLTIMSSTILFMPLTSSPTGSKRGLTVILGIILWLGAIVGYTSIHLANKERRVYITKRLKKDVNMNCRCGMFTFFANLPATVFDVAMVSSFLIFFIISYTKYKSSYLAYFLLFLFILSLNMHCLFNGRIYKAIQIKQTRREKSHE